MYKSLFLDKQPKFIKNPTFTQRVDSREEEQRRLKAIEAERKLKVKASNIEKKKKNQFYENLSKKAVGKKYKHFFLDD